jgi:hypothetical protein
MMQLVYANPRPATRKKKPRSAAQKAAFKKMLAARKTKTNPTRRRRAASQEPPMARRKRKATTRRRRTTTTVNPRKRRYSARARYAMKHRRVNPRHHYKRRHRNPSATGSGSLLKEFMSKDGLIMIAAGVAGATIPVMVQARLMPSLTGYTKTAARAAVGLAGAWLAGKYVSRKAGLAFGVVALASSVSEIINTWQANSLVQSVGVSDQRVADRMAENPALMDGFLSLNGGYDATPMTGGYDATPMTGLGAAPYMDYADASAYESLN